MRLHQVLAEDHRQEFVVGDLLHQSRHDVASLLHFPKNSNFESQQLPRHLSARKTNK